MRCLILFALGAAGLVAGSGCGGGGASNPAGPSPGTPNAAELALCVDLTNERRASVGRSALTRSSELETYAAQAARVDGLAHVGHKHWSATHGSAAENEVFWWPLSQYGSVRNVVIRGIEAFWNEGPGGGHYRNLTGRYTEGIFVNGDEATMTQEFR